MKKLNVCIIWHMHQPDYRDPVTGTTLLPWVWLHAAKDYGEILRASAAVEGVRTTFNLVPVLLEQLQRYAKGTANDRWLNLMRRVPGQLDAAERVFLVNNLFSVNAERHILPQPRYRELASKARGQGPEQFSDADLIDLQVLFLLAWAGHDLRREPLVSDLVNRGRHYSQNDKLALMERFDQEAAGVIDLYRQLEEEGRVEISFTPYAHPILPLLCDSDIAAVATPGLVVPDPPFRFPDDARHQIEKGREVVEACLGSRQRGMWPAEGAVSEEALSLMAACGAAWAASDEGILARSLPGGLKQRDDLYHVYRFGDLPLVFRDHELSDRIGFVYGSWRPTEAAADLLGRLEKLAEAHPGGVVTLILDGENCWESYEDNGHPFLQAFYRGLAASDKLRSLTVGEAVQKGRSRKLARVAPGSWINSDFRIWIGHPEENRAWALLREARSALGATETNDHLLCAEGSDWFWWYGDDHASAQAGTFDFLFRRHLEAAWIAAGLQPPDNLQRPIKAPRRPRKLSEPTALFTPGINGSAGDFFEWLAAGRADLTGSGAMHTDDTLFCTLLFGYDLKHLYLRLDPHRHQDRLLDDGHTLEISLHCRTAWRASFDPTEETLLLYSREDKRLAGRGKGAVGEVVELAIPLAPMGLQAGDIILLSIHLLEGDRELARWPVTGPVEIPYRGSLLEADRWYV
ncbi:MAG: glycoside hydrolase family 57 protein [Geothermobacteraceae bacterium]